MTEKVDPDSALFAVPEEESDEKPSVEEFGGYSPIADRDPVLFGVPETESSIEDIVPGVDGARPIRDRADDPLDGETGIGLDADDEAAALAALRDAESQRESAE